MLRAFHARMKSMRVSNPLDAFTNGSRKDAEERRARKGEQGNISLFVARMECRDCESIRAPTAEAPQRPLCRAQNRSRRFCRRSFSSHSSHYAPQSIADRIARSNSARQPLRGEAQGCAEQFVSLCHFLATAQNTFAVSKRNPGYELHLRNSPLVFPLRAQRSSASLRDPLLKAHNETRRAGCAERCHRMQAVIFPGFRFAPSGLRT